MSIVNFDPNWFEFLKSKGPGPVMTDDQLAESSRLDQSLKDIQDPNSPSYHKYLQGGEFATTYPGITAFNKSYSDWYDSIFSEFNQKSGLRPVSSGPGRITPAGGSSPLPPSPGTGYGSDTPADDSTPQTSPSPWLPYQQQLMGNQATSTSGASGNAFDPVTIGSNNSQSQPLMAGWPSDLMDWLPYGRKNKDQIGELLS